ncbi:MAG: type I-D CRISPR-associated protein Cas10d/Csc3 [Candidatus Lokiarchaeota archaeon]|nr:type I-D CRISPR-associated protein Cas10d/Csc3 [Candidatus Lokiarchaeota archaeon]
MSEAAEQYLMQLVSDEPVLKKYLYWADHSQAMAQYKLKFQYGKKAGESLYTHVLNGIFTLETLRPLLEFPDENTEARILFTAFTVHDINKVLDEVTAFNKLATEDNIAAEIERLELGLFFPAWRDHLKEVTTLVRGHSGHTGVAGESLIAGRRDYGLGQHRVRALIHLMRAADIIDLSHTLDERNHKATFLSHLNAYLADSGIAAQYVFFRHRLVEQRGVLSNVMHNAVIDHLTEVHAMTPLLFYPEGVAYLVMKGQTPKMREDDINLIAGRIVEKLNVLIQEDLDQFIESKPAGIAVDEKCLELGMPFREIAATIWAKVERRMDSPDPSRLDQRARQRAERDFEENKAEMPETAAQVHAALDSEQPIVDATPGQLRTAEFARSYFIFLKNHFAKETGSDEDRWRRVYRVLGLPEARWPFYAYFHARWDRAYVLASDLSLTQEQAFERIKADGEKILQTQDAAEDEKVDLFADYLSRYLTFSDQSRPQVDFSDALAHYVTTQHKQCIYCGGPFPTDKWMAADVRSDITVQVFSNRLRGGPGDPKKYICAICHLQFLLEKLNYPSVYNEKTLYLHLFPYSFFTAPFLQGLRRSLSQLRESYVDLQALNLNSADAINAYTAGEMVAPHFRERTQRDKPQPYGLYVPRFAETTGNLLIFPLNPAGDNDTERFLFALYNALVLQRYFGVKVLLSNAPVAPLGKENFADLYIDNIPLACEGLLPRSNYAQYQNGSQKPGTLRTLWENIEYIFALKPLVSRPDKDHVPDVVRALASSPLQIFYEVEKLIERRLQDKQWLNLELRKAFPHTKALALYKGGSWMAQLSEKLQHVAEIARSNHIWGRSFKKSSLLFPVAEVFDKLKQAGRAADRETLRAATVSDIFDHLYRIAEEQYKPGKTKREAIKDFVAGWYDGVLAEVYSGDLRRLLSDEKLIRSAYLFYFNEAGQDRPGEETESSQ